MLKFRLLTAVSSLCFLGAANAQDLELSEAGYYEADGVNVLVFSNWYDSLFSDSKIGGVEVIHHGERTVTNGDVRLSPTPMQWDPIATFGERTVDEEAQRISVTSSYSSTNYAPMGDETFNYRVESERADDGVIIRVVTDEPLPESLEGVAGFNLEFLPSAYWDKTYFVDGQSGFFHRYARGDMEMPVDGRAEQKPMASGQHFVLAPGSAEHRIEVVSNGSPISLYDGRNQAQNGWYVLRSMIPSDKTGAVVEWHLKASSTEGWKRKPVVSFSQVGYTPDRSKIAVVELDKNDTPARSARVRKVNADGTKTTVATPRVEPWGKYLRYNYAKIDFSGVTEPGVYTLQYQDQELGPFRIDQDVYSETWQSTLDIFFPVQMDHMFVNEGYRVWHGASHLDDALQAPVDHEHHDLYAQGPTTDTKFKPLEHIPGLNVGGWYDAGDYDIRTQSQYGTVRMLATAYEEFGIDRDQTKVDQKRRRVDMHMPDGAPDMLQQIEHGVLQLVAQFDAVGFAIHGIVEPDLDQYTHLGDGVTKTDNLIYSKKLGADEVKKGKSGRPDDRWAFTSRSSALNYGSIAALAAASRQLEEHNPKLAAKARKIAIDTFAEEQSHEPYTYRHGNTTGGPLPVEQFHAAAELYVTTGDQMYADKAAEFWEAAPWMFPIVALSGAKIYEDMPESFQASYRAAAEEYLANAAGSKDDNPFGVMITTGGWAGSGTVMGGAITQYKLHQMFPDMVDTQSILDAVDFLFGRHPGHNLSLVSAVGTKSKEVAYGVNRADFSFIAGGTVPGILILKPDFPENKEDWPFLWGENEYVIPMGANHIYLMHAVDDLLSGE